MAKEFKGSESKVTEKMKGIASDIFCEYGKNPPKWCRSNNCYSEGEIAERMMLKAQQELTKYTIYGIVADGRTPGISDDQVRRINKWLDLHSNDKQTDFVLITNRLEIIELYNKIK